MNHRIVEKIQFNLKYNLTFKGTIQDKTYSILLCICMSKLHWCELQNFGHI